MIELCFTETMVSVIVENGALPVLVKRLLASPPLEDAQLAYEYEVEKGSAFALGLLAIQVTSILSFLIFYSKLILDDFICT